MLLARLVEGEAGPHPQRRDFAASRAYEEAFYLWGAILRDGRLNDAERAAQFETQKELIYSWQPRAR